MPKRNPNDPFVATWKVYRKGKYIEVDPFVFARETIGATKDIFDKDALGAIFGPAVLKVTRGVQSDVTKQIYAIDINLIESSFLVKTKKGGRETKSILDEMSLGLKTLKEILSSDSLTELARKVYTDQTDGVIALLKAYLAKQQAFNIHTRPKQVAMEDISHASKDASGKISMPSIKNRNFPRKGGQSYSGLWENLLNNVVLGPPKTVRGGVTSFGLQDLIGGPFKLTSQNSSFTSIFLMEEFGTGMNVETELLRKYTKKGRSQSKFKVPPTIAAKFGQPEATAMWWPFPSDRYRAYALYASLLKGSAAKEKAFKKSLIYNNRVNLVEAKKEAINFRKAYETKNDQHNPLWRAYGRDDTQGLAGRFGRKARNLFFQREGIAKEIRAIQQQSYLKLFKLIDEEIHKVVPNFPSIVNLVFKGSVY